MTVYYTGNGDKGSSSIIADKSASKDDIMFDALGDIDELNSCLSVCMLYISDDKLKEDLDTLQDNLFSISALLANIHNKNAEKANVKLPDSVFLENEINRMGKTLPELKNFVMPGGSKASSYLHVARSIARRAERKTVSLSKQYSIDDNVLKYLNRLSSFLFVAALYLNYKNGIEEKNPRYL